MTAIPLTEKVKRIVATAPALARLRSVIEKELVHYDIFYVLQQKALMLPGMAFVGGTCLRLCYPAHLIKEELESFWDRVPGFFCLSATGFALPATMKAQLSPIHFKHMS